MWLFIQIKLKHFLNHAIEKFDKTFEKKIKLRKR